MGIASRYLHSPAPLDQRPSLWWLTEHTEAERAVTCASRALDMGGCAHMVRLTERRLDAALDYLELVENRCYAIIDGLRAGRPSWVADVAEAHYIKGETWATACATCGVSVRNAQRVIWQALNEPDGTCEG